jgi:O-antigen/teichoic acid export membrane protein
MHPSSPFHRLLAFSGRPLVRNLLQVSTGNIAGNALNLLALALLSMQLDPGPRGIFSSMQAAMMLMASLADFGLNTTIIKYYRDLADSGRPDAINAAEALMRRALWLRVAVAGALTGVAALLAGPVCAFWLGDAGHAGLFRLICLGAFGSALWMYCQAAMQARQRFGSYTLLTIGNHALRLALFIALILAGRMDVRPAVIVLMAAPFAGSLGAALLWPPALWRARMEPAEMRGQMRSVFELSKWIFLSSLITSLIMQLDVLMLGNLSDEAQVGQFGNALDLARGFPLITAALSTVLLPKLAGTRRRADMLRIMGYFLRAIPWLTAGAALAMAAAHLLIPYIRGGAYVPSIMVFDLLVVGFSISVIVNPLSFFCLAFERAHWLTWMNLAQLGINYGLNLALIPLWGALGAGASTLTVRVFAILFLGIAFRRLLTMAAPSPPPPA